MSSDCLKLTIYFGESDRVDGQLLSDVLLDELEAAQVPAAVLLRATEGFGIKQRLHTQRLLTLSEDLPLVVLAVDTHERIERLLPRVQTLDHRRPRDARAGPSARPRRRRRSLRRSLPRLPSSRSTSAAPSAPSAVPPTRPRWSLLRLHGLDGATVLLGVDGITHAQRHRGRFFSRNADVPLTIVASGSGEAVQRVLEPLGDLLGNPLLTLERVRVCKRDGRTLAEPRHLPETDDTGLAVWQKVSVHAAEDARHHGHALYLRLIRRLREDGASGATALRGIWGYSGAGELHRDRLLSLRRGVPIVTIVVDRPSAMQRLWPAIDELTDETGLVTSELVPAFQAVGPELRSGGLRLAQPRL